MAHYANIDGWDLEVPECWDSLTAEQRAEICNGVGPERWPNSLRKAFTIALGPEFDAMSQPHDVDYEFGRTEADRKAGDDRFRRNGIRIANQKYGGYWGSVLRGTHARRSAFIAQVLIAHGTLRRFGGSAFWAGKERPAA